MKLVVGIGNYGKEYECTRHNIGFMVLDYFPGNKKFVKKFNALCCEENINGEKVIFIKPLTYVNLSGDAVAKFANYYKIDSKDILIIQDDLDLSFLKYRLKYKSSAGGHNGMKSIISSLGTDMVPRLKIGIAHDRSIDTKDYVLGRISKANLEQFNEMSPVFKDIIVDFVNHDIEYCMQKYNKK